jgi:hypothetical protein
MVCLGASGCDFSSTVTPSPEAVPIRILLFGGGDCPLAGVPRRLTFRIDAVAPEQVVALDETATQYRVWWPEGFRGGSSDDPVVRDPRGLVVARDGEVLLRAGDDFPNLHGYSVCSGGDKVGAALWVQSGTILP